MFDESPTIVVVLMLISGIAAAQTVIPGGNVSGVWEAGGSPYLVQGEITVPGDETLTIEPNVEVIFQGHYKFILNGTLEAVGTEADSILFTAANPDTGWHGIRFCSASGGCHLIFCTIQDGRALDIGGVEDSYGGGIFCSQSNPTISRCTIRSNEADYMGGGICAYDNSRPVIEHCGIWDNCAGVVGGGVAYYTSTGELDSCTVSGNWAGEYGGGIYCYFSDPIITHCDINANTANDGEAGGVACNNSSPVVYHCIINNNWASYAGGGFCCVSSEAFVSYCIVSGNGAGWYGGGIKCSYSLDAFANCTVSQNSAGYAGGGFDCGYSGTDILNTIVEGNSAGGIYFYSPQNMSITYSDFYSNQGGNFTGGIPSGLGQIATINANGDSCDMFYNIFEAPLFEDPTNGNFQITWTNYPIPDSTRSPCIDAGHPRSPYDADSTVADIGALYFHQLILGIEDEKKQVILAISCLLPNFPNPFNSATTIRFQLPVDSHVDLRIHDISGRLVATLANGWREAGMHDVTFDGSGLPSGIYIARLQAGDFSAMQKLVLMK